jgi:hypothetical protein
MTMAQLLALIDVETATDGKQDGTATDWAMLGTMRLG